MKINDNNICTLNELHKDGMIEVDVNDCSN
jgi:hypothetical protein